MLYCAYKKAPASWLENHKAGTSFLESRGRYTKVGVYCYCAERCVR